MSLDTDNTQYRIISDPLYDAPDDNLAKKLKEPNDLYT